METVKILTAGFLGLALSVSAGAASFTSQTAFVNALQPGYIFNNFNSSDGQFGNPYDMSQGAFDFNASTDDNTTGPGGPAVIFFLDLEGTLAMNIGGGGNFGGGDTLTLNFTSDNVTAIGGDFFLTNFIGNLDPAQFTLGLSDGTNVSFSNADSNNFFGYTSSTPITSLTFNPGATNRWAVIDNLYVGEVAAAPEPSSWLLMLSAVGAGIALTRTRRRQV
jgi:hypothetical protein